MAKVYGQDIPSKYYDTYHNFFAHSFDQRHQPYGKSVKKSNWDFPGYPYHPHFPSPAQLYVRAIFKSATECWHLQPDVGGSERPDYGPIPKEWWEAAADKDRTFGYRKFMRDTLIQKFRVGEPTWCIPSDIPCTFTVEEFPDINYCESWNLHVHYEYMHRNSFAWFQKPPQDIGKEFLYVYAHHIFPGGPETVYIDARIPDWFVFDPCSLTWNTQPTDWLHTSRLFVLDPGWYRFYVGPYEQVFLRIYFSWFDVLNPDFYGGLIFHSPRSPDIEKRPYFALD